MTNLTEQYRELEQDFFAYQKMLNEANKDLNKYYLENTKLKELLKECSYRIDWTNKTGHKPTDDGRQKLFDEISQVLGEE